MANTAPPDVIRIIYSYLDPKSIVSCCGTCRLWRNSVDLESVWFRLLPPPFQEPLSYFSKLSSYRDVFRMRSALRLTQPFLIHQLPINPFDPSLSFWQTIHFAFGVHRANFLALSGTTARFDGGNETQRITAWQPHQASTKENNNTICHARN